MTTRITTPTDDEAYPTTTTAFGDRRSSAGRAPMLFSPTSYATMGQFDTEADQQG